MSDLIHEQITHIVGQPHTVGIQTRIVKQHYLHNVSKNIIQNYERIDKQTWGTHDDNTAPATYD